MTVHCSHRVLCSYMCLVSTSLFISLQDRVRRRSLASQLCYFFLFSGIFLIPRAHASLNPNGNDSEVPENGFDFTSSYTYYYQNYGVDEFTYSYWYFFFVPAVVVGLFAAAVYVWHQNQLGQIGSRSDFPRPASRHSHQITLTRVHSDGREEITVFSNKGGRSAQALHVDNRNCSANANSLQNSQLTSSKVSPHRSLPCFSKQSTVDDSGIRLDRDRTTAAISDRGTFQPQPKVTPRCSSEQILDGSTNLKVEDYNASEDEQ